MTKEDSFCCTWWYLLCSLSFFLSLCCHIHIICCLSINVSFIVLCSFIVSSVSLHLLVVSLWRFLLAFHLATPSHENYASLQIELTYEYTDEMQVMINILIMICLQIVYINVHHSWHVFI